MNNIKSSTLLQNNITIPYITKWMNTFPQFIQFVGVICAQHKSPPALSHTIHPIKYAFKITFKSNTITSIKTFGRCYHCWTLNQSLTPNSKKSFLFSWIVRSYIVFSLLCGYCFCLKLKVHQGFLKYLTKEQEIKNNSSNFLGLLFLVQDNASSTNNEFVLHYR